MKTCWETLKVEGASILDRLGDLLRAGNVRRVVVQQRGRTIAEFPLTAGVVGVVFAPLLAAVGAIIALLQDCTIQVEKVEEEAATRSDGAAPSEGASPA